MAEQPILEQAASPMPDQPLSRGYLEQFFRSFARPDLDRIAEERLAEARETR